MVSCQQTFVVVGLCTYYELFNYLIIQIYDYLIFWLFDCSIIQLSNLVIWLFNYLIIVSICFLMMVIAKFWLGQTDRHTEQNFINTDAWYIYLYRRRNKLWRKVVGWKNLSGSMVVKDGLWPSLAKKNARRKSMFNGLLVDPDSLLLCSI